MSKKLIITDASEAASYAYMWGKAKEAVQAVLTLYTATGLPALNNAEFPKLFNDTDNLLFDKMTGGAGGSLTFGTGEGAVSLPVDRAQAMALLTKPTGYNALITGIQTLREAVMKGWTDGRIAARFNIVKIEQYFKIDGGGLLQFSDKHAALIAEHGKVYIRTAPAKAMHSFTEQVVALYYEMELHTYSRTSTSDPINVLQAVIDRMTPATTSFVAKMELKRIDEQLLSNGYPESEDEE